MKVTTKTYSEPSQTSKRDFFPKKVNGKLFSKNVLDVWLGSE